MKRLESLSLIAQLSFGIALLLAGFSEMAGLAMIIGAYIAGLSFSQTDVAQEIIERITGVGDYFVPVFFAVMGMMVNFQALLGVLLFGLAFSLVAFLGKLIGCGLPALIVGFNVKGAFRIGAGMLPRGEVTLIVGGIGLATGAIGQDLFGVGGHDDADSIYFSTASSDRFLPWRFRVHQGTDECHGPMTRSL